MAASTACGCPPKVLIQTGEVALNQSGYDRSRFCSRAVVAFGVGTGHAARLYGGHDLDAHDAPPPHIR